MNDLIQNFQKELKSLKEFEFLIEDFKKLSKKKIDNDKIILILNSEMDDLKISISSKSKDLEEMKIREETLKKETMEKSNVILDLQNELNNSKSKFLQMKIEFESELNSLSNLNENLKKSLSETEKYVESLKNDVKDKANKDKQILDDSEKLKKNFEAEVNRLSMIIKENKNEEKLKFQVFPL